MKSTINRALIALACIALVGACGSGLGNVPGQLEFVGENARFGFDPGFTLSDPIVDRDAIGTQIDGRNVIFYAFETEAAADNGDGMGIGSLLDRGGVLDSNGTGDVFLSVLVPDHIDPTGFDQAIAGIARHPRCMTCHAMNGQPDVDPAVDDFIFMGTGIHPIPQGNLDGDLDPATPVLTTCTACHKIVADWRAPGPEKDFRRKSLEELAAFFQNPPAGETPQFHFQFDPRVDWALEVGLLPDVSLCADLVQGCPLEDVTNACDDDRDGVDEPSDVDGILRRPGQGKDRFVERVTAWFEGTRRTSSADLVVGDVRIAASVAGSSLSAGSSEPSVAFVASNEGGGVVGRAYVTYTTDESIVSADLNARSDVYRSEFLVSRSGDNFTLAFVQVDLVSVASSGGTGANDAYGGDIAANNPNLVVFESTSTSLDSSIFDDNSAQADVFLRDMTPGSESTSLLSLAGAAISGNDESNRPCISADGAAVAFDSNATNINFAGVDANGVRDVFYVLLNGGSNTIRRASVLTGGLEATGGDHDSASIAVLDATSGHVRVAFGARGSDLSTLSLDPSLSHAYVHDSSGGGITLLAAQRKTDFSRGTGPELSLVAGVQVEPESLGPIISPNGSSVAFSSEADNLDVLRQQDGNSSIDVFVVDLTRMTEGIVLPRRVSISADGQTGTKGSTAMTLGTFGAGSSMPDFVLMETKARNIGASDNTGDLFVFVEEEMAAVADFITSATFGVAPMSVMFQDASLGTATSWAWDFGDGSTSTGQNPTHIYLDASGSPYDVSLTVQTELGEASITKKQFIEVTELFSELGTYNGTDFVPGTLVQFRLDSSTAVTIDSVLWDFGDGFTSVTFEPLHAYGAAGSYDVSLTTTWTDTTELTTVETAYINVQAAVTSFVASDDDPVMDTTVSFTNLSVGPIASQAWNFGDGSTSTAVSPSHVYDTPGDYTVTLTNTFVDASTDVDTEPIEVLANFSWVYNRFDGQGPGQNQSTTGSCRICHAGGSASATSALNMSSQGTAFTELTTGSDSACGPYVDPSNPTASALYLRLMYPPDSGCGAASPMLYETMGGSTFEIPDAHRDEILSWIVSLGG